MYSTRKVCNSKKLNEKLVRAESVHCLWMLQAVCVATINGGFFLLFYNDYFFSQTQKRLSYSSEILYEVLTHKHNDISLGVIFVWLGQG